MKDFLQTLGALLGWLALRALSILWALLKLAVFVGILIGAIRNLIENNTVRLDGVDFSVSGIFDLFLFPVAVAAENWQIAGFVVVFWLICATNAAIKRMSSDVSQTKIGLITLLNYFETETETEGLKGLRDKGLWKWWMESLSMAFWGRVVGVDMDDALTARPVRRGESVSFKEDLERAEGAE